MIKHKLLVQAENDKWCVYYRNSHSIPTKIALGAKRIYNYDTKEEIYHNIGPMFTVECWVSKDQPQPDVDIDNLPVGEHIVVGSMIVIGIKFGDTVIG